MENRLASMLLLCALTSGCDEVGTAMKSAGVFFTASDYGSGTYLMSLSLETKAATILAPFEGNTDAKLFLDRESGAYFLAQRPLDATVPSSVRQYSAEGTLVRDLGGLPPNLYGLLRWDEGYLATGYSDGGVAVLAGDLARLVRPRFVPSGLAASDHRFRHLVGAASGAAGTYLVAGGTLDNGTAYQAHLLKFSNGAIEGAPIPLAFASGAPCLNVASRPGASHGHGMAALARDRFVLTCNPQWGTPAGTIGILAVDLSGDTPVVRTLVESTATVARRLYHVAGTDAGALLAEELGGDYPYTATKRVWMNWLDGSVAGNATYGGDLAFVPEREAWLTSCIAADGGGCRPKTFGLVDAVSRTVRETFLVELPLPFTGFAIEVH